METNIKLAQYDPVKRRRVSAKRKPGPKPRRDGTPTEIAAKTIDLIAKVADGLAENGTWPSPTTVSAAHSRLTRPTVARYSAVLTEARLKWERRTGRLYHHHWNRPEEDGLSGGERSAYGEGQERRGESSVEKAEGQTVVSSVDDHDVSAACRSVGCTALLAKKDALITRLEDDVSALEAMVASLRTIIKGKTDLVERLMEGKRRELPRHEDDGIPPV